MLTIITYLLNVIANEDIVDIAVFVAFVFTIGVDEVVEDYKVDVDADDRGDNSFKSHLSVVRLYLVP